MPQQSARFAPRRTIRNACLTLCVAATMFPATGAGASPALNAVIRPLVAQSAAVALNRLAILVQAQGEPAGFHAADISGLAGRPIPLRIEVSTASDGGDNQLFIFSGLPGGVTLQPGGFFGEFWAVNASVIDELTLTAPEGFSGTFTVWITRSRNQGSPARSASITVTIGGPPTLTTAAASPARIPDATSVVKPHGVVPNEAMLMARANDIFFKGDVSGARGIYEYLAMQGSSAAAMAMGETHDPLMLGKLMVKGLDADAKKAEQWYERAEKLGSQDARNRLNALAAR